MMLQALINTI